MNKFHVKYAGQVRQHKTKNEPRPMLSPERDVLPHGEPGPRFFAFQRQSAHCHSSWACMGCTQETPERATNPSTTPRSCIDGVKAVLTAASVVRGANAFGPVCAARMGLIATNKRARMPKPATTKAKYHEENQMDLFVVLDENTVEKKE